MTELNRDRIVGVSLPRDYIAQQCSLARTLEVVGERWTLLILRDAFYGARRFGEFARIGIPRAVLADRLGRLVDAGILERGGDRRPQYELTAKGMSLWPTVYSLIAWGDEHYAPSGPRRIFVHAADGAPLGPTGACQRCGATVPVEDILVTPGPGLEPPSDDDDPVSVALRSPHRLLEPLQREPVASER
jgi:DNA-binding HxlR family transcriptional regulator